MVLFLFFLFFGIQIGDVSEEKVLSIYRTSICKTNGNEPRERERERDSFARKITQKCASGFN